MLSHPVELFINLQKAREERKRKELEKRRQREEEKKRRKEKERREKEKQRQREKEKKGAVGGDSEDQPSAKVTVSLPGVNSQISHVWAEGSIVSLSFGFIIAGLEEYGQRKAERGN